VTVVAEAAEELGGPLEVCFKMFLFETSFEDRDLLDKLRTIIDNGEVVAAAATGARGGTHARCLNVRETKDSSKGNRAADNAAFFKRKKASIRLIKC
jgi:hypothetical protein